jgi:hypothetical protein
VYINFHRIGFADDWWGVLLGASPLKNDDRYQNGNNAEIKFVHK